MAKVPTYKCDVDNCKAVRDPSNGWFIYQQDVAGIITITPWLEKLADEGNVKHICGLACLAKQVHIDAAKIQH